MSRLDHSAFYPDAPGFKARDTSRAAAEGVAPKAGTLRARVLDAIRANPGTPEEIAARLGEPVLNTRPRCAELSAKGLIEDSGQRGPAMGGRRAIIWQAKEVADG
jgi:hypothetical protein